MDVEQPRMGTLFRIVACAPDSGTGEAGVRAALARVARLDSVLSDYAPDSEVSRLAATYRVGVPHAVSDDLWNALALADQWHRRTDGRFDAALGALTRPWRRAVRRGTLPDSMDLAEARAASGWRHVRLDAARRTVTFDVEGVRLDFGGIGKGLASDQALAVLGRHGMPAAVIDAGGDVRAGHAPPGARGWVVALPEESGGGRVWLADGALATSGDRYHFVEVDGVRYSHILDPATGLGVRTRRTVTVYASDGATADVLATTLSVAGLPEESGARAADALGVLVSGPGGTQVVRGFLPPPAPADAPPADCALPPGRLD